MRITSFVRPKDASVAPADTLHRTAIRMRTSGLSSSTALLRMLAIGCLDLPVVLGKKLIGIVSARELLAAHAHVYGVAV
jgi:CBS domain-containing protein